MSSGAGPRVLVINSGSSSVKFELFSTEPLRALLRGEVERIGESGPTISIGPPGSDARPSRGPVEAADHRQALRAALAALSESGMLSADHPLMGVGHRVVHGGDRFADPVSIDTDVLEGIRDMALLAPLHAKANVAGIEAGLECCGDVPNVAVFDTAFHRDMPPHAREYALPRALAREHGIRRYGFHGTSHAYVAGRAAAILRRPLEEIRLITLHLGNGASAAAIRGGISVDTSMGMTPLEGLVMGSRCGDVDPAVPMLLGQITGKSREDVHRLLNFESGLKGLTGERDMRAVHALADDGDPDALLAIEMYCYRAKKYVGAYLAVLGGADAIVFTAGVGENDPAIRARICEGLDAMGIAVEEARNDPPAGSARGERVISPEGAPVAVIVIPTDEGSEIARTTLECIGRVPYAVSVEQERGGRA